MTRARTRPLSALEIKRARIEEAERAELEKFDRDDRPRRPPPLAANPSGTTLEAIEIVQRPWTLGGGLSGYAIDMLSNYRQPRGPVAGSIDMSMEHLAAKSLLAEMNAEPPKGDPRNKGHLWAAECRKCAA